MKERIYKFRCLCGVVTTMTETHAKGCIGGNGGVICTGIDYSPEEEYLHGNGGCGAKMGWDSARQKAPWNPLRRSHGQNLDL